MLWAVRTGVALVLIAPLIVTPDTIFPYVVGKALFARSVIEITFGLWLILIFCYPQHRPSRSWILLALVIWLLVSLVASFTGVSPTRSLWSNFERMQGVVDRAYWVAFVLIAASVFRTLADWRLLFTLNLGVCGLVSFLGLGQHYGLFDSVLLQEVEARVGSTLGNATYLASYTMVNVIIGLGLLCHSFIRQGPEQSGQRRIRRAESRRRRQRRAGPTFDYRPWLRPLWALAILLCLWALWLTGTRSAIVGLGAGALVFAVIYIFWGRLIPARRVAYVILALTVLAVVFIGVARTSPVLDPVVDSSILLQRLTAEDSEATRSVSGRFASITAGLRAYQDKPVLGWGPENFLIAWGKYFGGDSEMNDQFDQAHNRVVEELVGTGAVGLLAYMLVWFAMAYVLIRSIRLRRDYEQLLVLAIGAAMVAYYVQNLFLFDTPGTVMLFALFLGFAVAEERWVLARGDGTAEKKSLLALPIFQATERWGRGLGLARSKLSGLLHRRWVEALAIGLLVVLVGGTLFLFSVRPYTAAVAAAKASSGSLPWADRAAYFNQAIQDFPGLANWPRTQLMTAAAHNVADLTDEEFAQLVALITEEGRQALEDEPQNWFLHSSLAQFYQVAATRDIRYLELARAHINTAVNWAPLTYHVNRVRENQEELEQSIIEQSAGANR